MFYNDNPNFSIIVTDKCNAKCKFCFGPKGGRRHYNYAKKLSKTLDFLPSMFTRCSITGGEPTMYKGLLSVLKKARARFDKVVLYTNGYKMRLEYLDYIDHLNVSRHGLWDDSNYEIFNTETVIGFDELLPLVKSAHNRNVDVTINTFLPKFHKGEGFIDGMIDVTRAVNADSICFRKEASNLRPMPVEKHLPPETVEYECPVCKVATRKIKGMNTLWKYSVVEPSVDLGKAYELIFHPDGRLTTDWQGKNEFSIEEWQDSQRINDVIAMTRHNSSRDYCGHVNRSGGC